MLRRHALPAATVGDGPHPDCSRGRLPSDTALVARMARGDEAALGVLYDRHGGVAYRLAFALTHTSEGAEDVVSAVFAQLWRESRELRTARQSVLAWMMARVRRIALARRGVADGSPRGGVRIAQDRAARSRQAAGMKSRQVTGGTKPIEPLVRKALAELPEAQRVAVERAYFGGLTRRELAIEQEEPVTQVTEHLGSAMHYLRRALLPRAGTFEEPVTRRG
jgi:RNA polymerase sigma-70 factor (ECF subfamily)